jgi:hypothetical protein
MNREASPYSGVIEADVEVGRATGRSRIFETNQLF